MINIKIITGTEITFYLDILPNAISKPPGSENKRVRKNTFTETHIPPDNAVISDIKELKP